MIEFRNEGKIPHISEASVLGFDVDPYVDLDHADLSFSLDDLQYLRYHFEVFSTVLVFGLTTEEMVCVKRLDAYLDTRDARIAYEEGTSKALQTQDQASTLLETDAGVEDEMATPTSSSERAFSFSPVVVDDAVVMVKDQDNGLCPTFRVPADHVPTKFFGWRRGCRRDHAS